MTINTALVQLGVTLYVFLMVPDFFSSYNIHRYTYKTVTKLILLAIPQTLQECVNLGAGRVICLV